MNKYTYDIADIQARAFAPPQTGTSPRRRCVSQGVPRLTTGRVAKRGQKANSRNGRKRRQVNKAALIGTAMRFRRRASEGRPYPRQETVSIDRQISALVRWRDGKSSRH